MLRSYVIYICHILHIFLESESVSNSVIPTFCDTMDCSPPGPSVHGILQARILEWGAIPFSKGSSWPRDWTWISHIAGRLFTVWATKEANFVIFQTVYNVSFPVQSFLF